MENRFQLLGYLISKLDSSHGNEIHVDKTDKLKRVSDSDEVLETCWIKYIIEEESSPEFGFTFSITPSIVYSNPLSNHGELKAVYLSDEIVLHNQTTVEEIDNFIIPNFINCYNEFVESL